MNFEFLFFLLVKTIETNLLRKYYLQVTTNDEKTFLFPLFSTETDIKIKTLCLHFLHYCSLQAGLQRNCEELLKQLSVSLGSWPNQFFQLSAQLACLPTSALDNLILTVNKVFKKSRIRKNHDICKGWSLSSLSLLIKEQGICCPIMKLYGLWRGNQKSWMSSHVDSSLENK